MKTRSCFGEGIPEGGPVIPPDPVELIRCATEDIMPHMVGVM